MAKNSAPFNIPEKQTALSSGKVLLSISSGVLLTASFPPVNLSFLSWFALVPLLKSIENESSSRAFKLGLMTGTVHYLTLMYWIVVVLGRYGNLNAFLSAVPCLLLCLYLALYIAAFSLMTACSRDSRFFLLFLGSFWVGLEYIRAKFLSGFPWCLLGYTQYRHLNLIQIADIFGVYGLSFLIVLVNGLIYCLLFRNRKTKNDLTGRRFLKWETPIIVLLVGGTLAYGHYRLSELQERKDSSRRVRVAVIQGNIDQSLKWDPAYQTRTLETYGRLTRAVHDFRPELILWPETAVPFFFQDNDKLSPEVVTIAEESGGILVFGSPAFKRTAGRIDYYNRAYLISADEEQLTKYYDKVHLVPFGEYVPFKRVLSFINRLVPAAGDFAEGDEIVTLEHDNLSIGALICFETIFPEIARAHTRKGANILVNLTNDAWFGKTSAPYQHLAMAVFRAVENRRTMIRAANTGFSATIGPQGKIMMRSNLFCEETLKASVSIPDSPLTVYTRFGDLFALSLLVICLIKSFSCLQRRKNNRHTSGRLTKLAIYFFNH